MKRLIAILLFLVMLFTPVLAAYNEAGPSPATPTDLGPVTYDYTINRSNMPHYNIVAFNNATINGHIRGSIYVGGTLTGSQYVDDGSIDGVAASNSYVRNNQSQVYFKGRTGEQSLTAYYCLSEQSANSTAIYWKNFIENLPNNETYVYLEPDENGTVSFGNYEYQANGSDIAYRTIEKIYWTDATTVNMAGMAGHLIAPYATVNITWCNFCGSVIANNVVCNGEAHINTFIPPTPEPNISESPSPSPSPTPTPTPIIVTKKLKGEIWQVRCDTMDNTDFKAGGGYWAPDISNYTFNTGKEGHRSNHCGNAENWVLFVNEEGIAISLYQLKSGSTGGTLPSLMYRAPADLASIPESQLIYDPTDPNDVMTARLINEVFIPENVMPFDEINLVEGQRLFWISQNGKQVWHHTGVLKKTDPKFAIVVNGETYLLGVDESATITDIEDGLVQVEEIATANYKLHEIQRDEEGNIIVINEIDPPDKPTPTAPPPVVTPTPSPSPSPEVSESPSPSPEVSESPSPSPEVSESPSPSPEVSESPSPSPEPTCGFTIKKLVTNYELMDEDTIFFFKIRGVGFEEEEYVEIVVDHTTGIGTWSIDGLKPGKYTITEIDIPTEFELVSDENITLYVHGLDTEFIFENKVKKPEPSESPTPTPSESVPPTTVTPSEVPSESPSPTPSPTPTPTVTTSPIPSESPSPTPSPTASETPTPSPTPSRTPPLTTVTPSEVPSDSPSPTPSPTPTPTVTTSPVPPGGFQITKVVTQTDVTDYTTFYFKVTGPSYPEGEVFEIEVQPQYGQKILTFPNIIAGEYIVEEVNIPETYTFNSVSSNLEIADNPTTTEDDLPLTAIRINVPENGGAVREYNVTFKNDVIVPEPTESPEPKTIVIGAHKEWNDKGNDNNRPEYVVVTLYADNIQYQTFRLSNENEWTINVEVPQFTDTEEEIQYSWTESTVVGYVLEKEYDTENIHTFVNAVWERPEEPEQKGRLPKMAGPAVEIEDYGVPLGVAITINHVGDCFD